MDKPKTMPKDFFLWAGAMVALYVGVFNYIALLWDYINYAIPDPLAYNNYYYSDPYQSGISWEMATLIVLVPAFLILMWLIRRDIKRDPTRNEIWVRRWALFLTLFVAGATVVVDLIYVLYAFLNGTDLTTHFLLKALVVLLVAALGFMHFIADLWGYWEQYPARNRYVVIATALLVVVTIIAGFFIVGTPGQARLMRFDTQRVQDLQNIQDRTVYFWQQKGKLPATLKELNDPISGYVAPVDPQTKAVYEYHSTGALSFELCSTFDAKDAGTQMLTRAEPVGLGGPGTQSNWAHSAGRVCFERTIDTQLYPPTPKTAFPVK